MWPYIWILFMLSLVIATAVVGMRESSARKKAVASMQPQPLDHDGEASMDQDAAEEMGDDMGFGAEADGDFASFDEDAFK